MKNRAKPFICATHKQYSRPFTENIFSGILHPLLESQTLKKKNGSVNLFKIEPCPCSKAFDKKNVFRLPPDSLLIWGGSLFCLKFQYPLK